ncbi:N-acetylglucosamine-specific PTS transporter subunit IIBC [Tetragenococcus koreensis]|uniref:N-acetylglucosamine-specific PTS system IIABC component n=1 Tax=Tetragenococcus koreensis TaxID=290335 RepID=A0AAN4UBU9_9ENTE|nr:N-acetylglucosamine-specific PTS transporter subunit IIBC [Tetragenococcus koreensis]AYW46452.1 PTS N-acetylglucosamine transporter subunit IIABC [Tetragenococcus koreensis]MCF1585060.1 N-acetylglucosamine-specific PTS transporter subunit IIBC [Tetragenococcus koreensis]MCF1629412.1 N-acetylglucosamine-specific PTS transporter subunit IIBC [Tetragenococcus koreensis]MDN6290478.1 N-acetylglucosamine-specific PTS transporter subunit IIBC [Tetragenococcus koreensis]MDN6347326.1 N-acetylglucosa
MKAYMQRMGRSLMLPVATLPVAALFMGIGYWIDPSGWGENNIIAAFLIQAGGTILDNLGILFAVGIAIGMAKDKDGSSALAGLVAFLTPMTLVNSEAVATFTKVDITEVNVAFEAINNENVFVGIVAGLVAAALYNRFNNVKLPMALSFFSGKRSVPIVTAVVMSLISVVFIFVWPTVYTALVTFGEFISGLGALGAGLYGFFNRLLIPTGLHHALNNVFWFNLAGIDDIGKFWANDGIKGITGMYQAGFFPVMMFGLPAGALAMYHTARPEKKKETASLMLAAAFASFFTGVTEPLEFAFMFVAWPLYVVHALLTGLSMFIVATFQWTAGFNFSAGLVDFVLSLRVPIANQPYMLLVFGLVMAVVYYFTFRFVITKFNLMTPGREESTNEEMTEDIPAGDDKFAALAQRIYAGLGKDNLVSVDNCTTRLRLQVKDTQDVDQAKIKATGVPGVKAIDKNNIQIIVGTEVQFVADELSRLHTGAPVASTAKPVEAVEEISAVNEVYAAANGTVIPMTEVSDDVFSQKMMGDGYAVLPNNGEIFAPVAGKITNIFPTKHALGIETAAGVEVLLHMGIDTVTLKGEPFNLYVTENQKIARGQLLAKIDLEAIEKADRKTDIIVVFTNPDNIADLAIEVGDKQANDIIGSVEAK